MYPINYVLHFFYSLVKMRILLFRKLKNDPDHTANIRNYIQQLMFGSFAVKKATKLGFVSIAYAGNKLNAQTPYQRKHLAKLETQDADTAFITERDLIEIDHEGVNMLTAITRRYANTSCRSIEKSLQETVAKNTGKKKQDGADNSKAMTANVALRPTLAALCTHHRSFMQEHECGEESGKIRRRALEILTPSSKLRMRMVSAKE